MTEYICVKLCEMDRFDFYPGDVISISKKGNNIEFNFQNVTNIRVYPRRLTICSGHENFMRWIERNFQDLVSYNRDNKLNSIINELS